MTTNNGFPYLEIEFDAIGQHSADRLTTIVTELKTLARTDVLFLSHGWNNDIAEARGWYSKYLKCLRDEVDVGTVPGIGAHKLAVVAIFWPSKRFADRELTAGQAHSIGDAATSASVRAQCESLGSAFAAGSAERRALDKVAGLVARAHESSAQNDIVDSVRTLFPFGAVGDDGLPNKAKTTTGELVLQQLAAPILDLPRPHGAAAGAGGAAGVGPAGGALGGIGNPLNGVRNLLNLTTFYTMKARAGDVGRHGVALVVARVMRECPTVRTHLAGHSFGARLVTAVAKWIPNDLRVQSLFLMQGAFSHYGLSANYDGAGHRGAFNSVLDDDKVQGPILITHTRADKAVGLAYPLAARLGGQVAEALGDENDTYGGMGRNGAQKTPGTQKLTLLAPNKPYALTGGTVHNLDANGVIGGHGDICTAEVAHALAAAIAS